MASRDITARLVIKDDGTVVLKRFGDTAEREMKKAADSASQSSAIVSKSWLAAAAAVAGFTLAINKAINAAKKYVQLANEQVKAEMGLATAMKLSGQYSEQAFGNLKSFASGLQDVTNYGDEAVLQVEKLLVTLTDLGTDQIPRATAAVADMASALGMDLQASANLVSKALSGNIGALSRYGIKLDDARVKAEGADYILGELEKRFKGQAETARQATGPWTALSNAIGDAGEEIGKLLKLSFDTWGQQAIEIVKAVSKVISDFTDRMREAQRVEIDFQIKQLQELLKTGRQIIDMGGLGPDLEIQGLSDDERKAIQERLEALQKMRQAIISPAGTAGAGTPAAAAPQAPGGEIAKVSEEAYKAAMEADEQLKAYKQQNLQELQAMQSDYYSQQIEQIYNQHQFELEQEALHAANIVKLREEAEQQKMQVSMAYGKQYVSWISSNFAAAARATGKGQKALFALHKVAAIAETIVATQEAAMHSYNWGAAIGGPPLGAAMAAIATAAGLARVAAIQQTGIGGSGAGAGGGGGGAAAGTGAAVGRPEFGTIGRAEQEEKGQVNIYLQGDILADEYYLELLAEKMSKAVEDKEVRLIATETRAT